MQIDFQQISIELAYKIAQLELNLTMEQQKVMRLTEQVESLTKEKENEK